jgi:zinc protease
LLGIIALPAPAREGIFVQKLPNGLTLILEENHTQPLIAVSLCVNGGSRTETPEISGLSHYYEHLIYRGGSKEMAPLEFRRKMQELGEESGGYTADDYTNYGFTVPVRNFAEAFRRATDDWLDLAVSEEKIAAERQVVLEEYNQDDDRPDDQVYRRLLKLIYRAHPYQISPLGTREAIEKADLQTFRTFYAQRYAPNQMVLSIVGDFDTDAMAGLVAQTWGARPAGPACFESGVTEPTQADFRFAEKKMQTSTTKVLVAFPIPPAVHADLPACDLAAALLASGKSSRLWQALKISANQAISVSGWLDRRVDPGFWAFSLEVEPGRLDEALRTTFREITALRDRPPTEGELGRVREALLAARERSLETFFARAEALGSAAIFGSPLEVDRYPALLRSVKPEDVTRVVQTYLRPDRGNLSLVSPDSAPSFDPSGLTEEWRKRWGDAGRASAVSALPAPVRFQLKNGLTVVVQPRPSSGMLGVVVQVRGGQWVEPAGKCGLADFTASLLDRGAAGKTQVEIAETLNALGATLHAGGDHDYIAVRLEAPAQNQAEALDLLAEVLTWPTFPVEEIEKVREDILSSIRSLPDRPFENTNEAFYRALYTNSPYGRPVEGTETSIREITRNDINEFYKTNVVGANVVVAVAGAVDPGAIRSWAERWLGSLPNGRPVSIVSPPEPVRASPLDTLIVRKQEQTTYNTGWPAVSVRDPDYLPLRVAVRVLQDRFFFKYVYEKGVAYRSWFYMTHRLGQGSIQNEMGVSPGVYREIAREVDSDLARFAGQAIPEADLAAAKEKVTSAYTLEVQTSSGLASALVWYELSGMGLDGYRTFPDRIRAVTGEQASAAARKYIVPGRSIRVGVGEARLGD